MRRLRLGGRPARRDERAVRYRTALEQQAASGLNMAEFASHVGVSTWVLLDWRQRVADDDAGDVSSGLIEVDVERRCTPKCAPPRGTRGTDPRGTP
jgi:hypothetical protein